MEIIIMKKLKEILSEINYREYKRDKSSSSKKKLNMAIKEVNSRLFQIERFLKQNKRLREEEGLGLTEYWKATAVNLVKMNERIMSLQKEIKNFGLKEIMKNMTEEVPVKKSKTTTKLSEIRKTFKPGDLVTSDNETLKFIKYNSDNETFTGKRVKSRFKDDKIGAEVPDAYISGYKINGTIKPLNETNAATWSKQQLDKELKLLKQGAAEAGDIDDSMAWDIADGWLDDNKGVETAIKKWYPKVSDFKGFVANHIA